MCNQHEPAVFLLGGAICLLGCVTESIGASDRLYLTDDGGSTGLEIWFTPDFTLETTEKFRIRVDGRWLVYSPDEPNAVSIQPMSGFARRADNLAWSSHTFDFVDSHGAAVLTTGPLDFTVGRAHQLVVHGQKDELAYTFFTNTDAELASVPSGMVLTRAINVNPSRPAYTLRSCSAATDPVPDIDAADCTVVVESFGYGQIWEAMLPREAGVGIGCCAGAAPSAFWRVAPLAPRCPVVSADEVWPPPRIAAFALTAPDDFFVAKDSRTWCSSY